MEGVLWTFSHLSYLQKYSSHVILPQFSPLLREHLRHLDRCGPLQSDLNIADIPRALFLKEFNALYQPRQYEAILASMRAAWCRIEREFFNEVLLLSHLRVQPSYRCYLTFYGGGGSFGRGNEIYVRINPRLPSDAQFANYVIMHELVHLMVDSYAASQRLDQSATEQLVDSIIEHHKLRALLRSNDAECSV